MSDNEVPERASGGGSAWVPGSPSPDAGEGPPKTPLFRQRRVLFGGVLVVILLAAGGIALGMRNSGKKPGHPSFLVVQSPSPGSTDSPGAGPSSAPSSSPRRSPSPSPSAAPSPTPNPSPTSDDPSGVPMPTGNLPGWTMVLSDDFTGNAVNQNRWSPYSGQPGGDPNGWWDPSHVVEGGGVLNLETYVDPSHANPANPNGYVSGGVSSGQALHQTYGKYEVRFRIDQGDGIASALLLWPAEGGWPPEIDFAENGSGVRDHMTATLHYGAADNTIAKTVNGNFTTWHTLGVEWTPGHLAFTLDGTTWGTITDPNVPSEPMELDMQAQAGTCGQDPCPGASTPSKVDMQIDWVAVYAYTPGSTGSST
ncbi:MAG TPA: glycoside hydrolase family 16 protein [Actinomycetota bacterium]|nr:glycoside hydrolase family 16 protein [Actinomycetota bacterium]